MLFLFLIIQEPRHEDIWGNEGMASSILTPEQGADV
jgi:hypothetical protein